MASSSSWGRLVAASTMTDPLVCWRLRKPSHRVMNSVFMFVTASCSPVLRLPRNESTSSTKMIAGANFHASVKTAVTSFCASPNHLLCSDDTRTLMNAAPDSFAMALASMVLPVPGGPYRSTPFTGWRRLDVEYRSGRRSGQMISSCRLPLMFSMPPMPSNVTSPAPPGRTTSASNASSYWFVVVRVRPRRFLMSVFIALTCFESVPARVGSILPIILVSSHPPTAATITLTPRSTSTGGMPPVPAAVRCVALRPICLTLREPLSSICGARPQRRTGPPAPRCAFSRAPSDRGHVCV
mmetsp:Transcript_8375/g.33983  ORF Transcript_8375/g.33983 Transcript_8375/m.33983 type:complete len:297 (+) Transcript_8375:624-1514(+)